MIKSAANTLDSTTQINNTIDEYLDKSNKRAEAVYPSYARLWDSLHNLVRAGGKRLRPRMSILAYEAFGGQDIDEFIPIAVAQELLHIGLLIHDDIIDRDNIRYGAPNVTGQYHAIYGQLGLTKDNLSHYSNSAAILAGDLMISEAYQMIMQSKVNDADKLTATRLLGQGMFDVAGGELLDTESAFRVDAKADALVIARYKTASYSFVTPLLTGAEIAGANTDQISLLRTYAIALGIAFQLADDLLGVFGNEEETGKSNTGDIREGKYTFLVEQCLKLMSTDEKTVFEKYFGNSDSTPEEIEIIRKIMIGSGARQKTEESILKYATQARQALEGLLLEDRYYNQFNRLILKATERKS